MESAPIALLFPSSRPDISSCGSKDLHNVLRGRAQVKTRRASPFTASTELSMDQYGQTLDKLTQGDVELENFAIPEPLFKAPIEDLFDLLGETLVKFVQRMKG